MSDPARIAALKPFQGQPCPFCGVTLDEPTRPHEVVPCPLYNTPYYVQQLAFAHLRLLERLRNRSILI